MPFYMPANALLWSDTYASWNFLCDNNESKKINKTLKLWKTKFERVEDFKVFYQVNFNYGLLYVNEDLGIEFAHSLSSENDHLYGIIGNDVSNDPVRICIERRHLQKVSIVPDEHCHELDLHLNGNTGLQPKSSKKTISKKKKSNDKTERGVTKRFRNFMIVPAIFVDVLCSISKPLLPLEIQSKISEVVQVVETTESISCDNILHIKNFALWIVAWCYASKRTSFQSIIVLDVVDDMLSRRLICHRLDPSSRLIVVELERKLLASNAAEEKDVVFEEDNNIFVDTEPQNVDESIQNPLHVEMWSDHTKFEAQREPCASFKKQDPKSCRTSLISNQIASETSEYSSEYSGCNPAKLLQDITNRKAKKTYTEFSASPGICNMKQVTRDSHQLTPVHDRAFMAYQSIGTDSNSSSVKENVHNRIAISSSSIPRLSSKAFVESPNYKDTSEQYLEEIVAEILKKHEEDYIQDENSRITYNNIQLQHVVTDEQIDQTANNIGKQNVQQKIEGIVFGIKIQWNARLSSFFQNSEQQQDLFWSHVSHRVFDSLPPYPSTESIDWSFLLNAAQILGPVDNNSEYATWLNDWDTYEIISVLDKA